MSRELGFQSGTITAGAYGGFGMKPLPKDGLHVGECSSTDRWLKCTGGCNDLAIGAKCRYGGDCGEGALAGINIKCSGMLPFFAHSMFDCARIYCNPL